jgi:hypothetical protein
MQSSPTMLRRRASGALLPTLVLAVLATGLASCGQSADPPPKPSAAFALPGNGTAAVTWAAPDRQADVTSTVATAHPGGRSCSSAKATRCVITGLANGTKYTIAVQSVGSGGRSTALTFPYQAGIPWPPAAVTGVPGDSSATLTWKAPYFSASPVTQYKVTSYPAGGACVSATTTCTVTGLKNDASYSFIVIATNAFGTSGPSRGSPSVTPSNTAGGSAGIVYLGPVNANQESTTGTTLQRDAGISVALPNGRDLWIFGDTSSFSAASGQSNAFIGGSTAAKGRYTPGQTPNALKDIKPAGSGAAVGTAAPAQFIPTPTDTYMPDGSGRACTPANGAVYTARWPTGAALLDTQTLFVSYTDVCVTSATSFTVEGWGFMTYAWRSARIRSQPFDVFPPAPSGAPLPAERAYQSPIVANGKLTLFTSQCTSLYIACTSGTVSATTLSSNVLVLAVASNYVSSPAVTDGTTQWMPVNVSVAAYPTGLRLIEQTSIGGTFLVFSSSSPTGPWHPFYSGTLPGCSTTPKGFCYAFVGHPELGSNTSLLVSYFKPDSPQNANIGHVDLALVPLTAP